MSNERNVILRWFSSSMCIILLLVLGNRYDFRALLIGTAIMASMAAYVGSSIKGDDAQEKAAKKAVDYEAQLRRMKLQISYDESYLRYMAAEIENPCRFCGHQGADGKCARECMPGTDKFAFEWKGLPDIGIGKIEEDTHGTDRC